MSEQVTRYKHYSFGLGIAIDGMWVSYDNYAKLESRCKQLQKKFEEAAAGHLAARAHSLSLEAHCKQLEEQVKQLQQKNYCLNDLVDFWSSEA